MRHAFFAAAVLAAVGLASPAPAEVRVVPSEKLVVNSDDGVRFWTEIGLRDGLAALEDIAFFAKIEEAWTYDARRTQWMEVGYGASGWSAPTFGEFLSQELSVASSARVDMVLYERERYSAFIHIHPVEGALDYKQARVLDEYATQARAISLVKIRHAIPSATDVCFAFSDHDVLPWFTYYIASFGGVTAYRPTTAARERFATIKEDKEKTAYCNAIVQRWERVASEAIARSPFDHTAILEAAFAHGSEDLNIQFSTYRDLVSLVSGAKRVYHYD